MSSDGLPYEVSRGTVNIGGFEIEVVQLSNGERVVTDEGLASFFAFLDAADPDWNLKNITPERPA